MYVVLLLPRVSENCLFIVNDFYKQIYSKYLEQIMFSRFLRIPSIFVFLDGNLKKKIF
jgi:hypothetical protein